MGLGVAVLVLGSAMIVGVGRVISARTDVPSDVGVVETAGASGRLSAGLQDCGSRSNCALRTLGIPATSDGRIELQRITAVMIRNGGVLRAEKPNYVHAVFRSRVFRFPDDVQVLVDSTNHKLILRSASRLGSGDGGVNSARLAALTKAMGLPDVVADGAP